jgi:hypothetical protein
MKFMCPVASMRSAGRNSGANAPTALVKIIVRQPSACMTRTANVTLSSV